MALTPAMEEIARQTMAHRPPEPTLAPEPAPKRKRERHPLRGITMNSGYAKARYEALEAFHVNYFSALLRASKGNITEAARVAGLDRSNFRRFLRRFGIEKENFSCE